MREKPKAVSIFLTIFIFLILINSNIMIPNIATKADSTKELSFIDKKISIVSGFKIKFFKTRFVVYKKPNMPPSQKKGFPVLFLFHGAVQHAFSWFLGLNNWNKAQMSFTNSAIENGFFVVSFESLKPIKPGPRAWNIFEETYNNSDFFYVRDVIDWLKNSSLTVDMNSIYCAGFSSGAFFCSELSQYFDYKFKGVVLNSGCNVECIDITKTGPVFNFTTGQYISSFHPSTLIVHGKKDRFVPYECAESYYQDLKSNNINVTKLIDETGGHIWLKKYNDQIIGWLKNT